MAVIATRGSRASKVIERAWKDLRAIDPRIPRAVIVLIDAAGRRRKHGHFAHSQWRAGARRAHEVAISPGLFQHPKHALATLVHEAAHAILWKDQHGGVTGPYYHTKVFRNVCRELELDCQFHNNRYGWTNTGWKRGRIPERYEHVLRRLERGLPQGTSEPPPRRMKPGRLPPSGLVRLNCECAIPRTVLVAKRSREGAITCGLCRQPFTATG